MALVEKDDISVRSFEHAKKFFEAQYRLYEKTHGKQGMPFSEVKKSIDEARRSYKSGSLHHAKELLNAI